jgi:hypothetical protein
MGSWYLVGQKEIINCRQINTSKHFSMTEVNIFLGFLAILLQLFLPGCFVTVIHRHSGDKGRDNYYLTFIYYKIMVLYLVKMLSYNFHKI